VTDAAGALPRLTRASAQRRDSARARAGTRRAKTPRMTKLIAFAFALTAVSACSKGDASCADVVDHVQKITKLDLPAELRKGAIEKCEQQPASMRACAMKADSMEALQACK
jgi:hypothetical protein